ncbi:MAG: glycosyltransferase family 39 protein [Endomicrobiaceae bacterium]|nr:glycosyltransferase family 39 protein [Endomicrobiaceae bacterium]
MNFNKKRFDSAYFIFLTITIWYAIGNFIWWQINTPVMPTDISAVHFLDIFKEFFILDNAPLITWIMKGMFFIFGKEYYDLIVIFVNYIFFLVPLYFIYKIGVELKDKETGNIAMILFALVPAVYGMSRQYGHQDYHIIAGITFNIYCLIKTDYFKNKKWAIWYGISVGLGLMIKDAFLAYFFVPFMYIVTAGLKEKTDKTKIINILTAIGIGSLIAGWHYFRLWTIKKILYEPVRETVSVFAFENLRVMSIGLWEELLSPPIFIIFAIGLMFFIWKYRGKYKNIILLWFFVPWTLIMFMPHYKLVEYGAGFIPAIILISVIWISNIEYKYIKKIIFLLLIAIGILQYVNFSYGILDFKLFKMRANPKYIKYDFKYYNKYNALIVCNKDTKSILQLMNYLKDNYRNYNYFYSIKSRIDCSAVLVQMYLNNMSCRIGYYDDQEILLSDIIINLDYLENINEMFDFKMSRIFMDPFARKNITEQIKNSMLLEMEYAFKIINEKYHIIDVYYLDKHKPQKIKVILLGRKDKFHKISN